MSDSGEALSVSARRPRPVISCLECRRKKLKCSRTRPCQQCLKIGRPGRCEYQAGQEPEPNTAYSPQLPSKRRRLSPQAPEEVNGIAHEHHDPQTPLPGAPASGLGVIEDLQERVARLESALQRQHSEPQAGSAASQTPQDLPWSEESSVPGHVCQYLEHTRSQFSGAYAFLESLQTVTGDSELASLRTQLQDLHHSVEMHQRALEREPAPTPIPTPSPSPSSLQLPPYHVCEKLAVLYFGNMEHCFRILHWPLFRDQLRILFTDGLGEQACHFAFVPQLVGVLAMGVIVGTHREIEAVRSCAVLRPAQALAYMRKFLQEVKPHQRYRLATMQVKMLLTIAGWLNSEPMDDLFRLNGELLRDALVIKMDQDPSTLPGVGLFEGELRRRNWMTILESDLMLSMLCNMPCLVPPYNSRPPLNVNDEDIYEGIESLPPSRPTTEWTDGLCQYILSHSFPRRLAACKQMDSVGPARFENVLQHTRYLERALQELPPPLRFNYAGDEASKTPPRLMARIELDISIRRPLMHLYSCCGMAPIANEIQLEAKAGFLQSCLMILNYQDLFDPQYSELNVPRPQGYWDLFYNCYRQEMGQATLGLCSEIVKLSRIAAAAAASTPGRGDSTPAERHPSSRPVERAVRGPTYTKESLLSVVVDALEPMIRRLSHRGAQVKDLVYYKVIMSSMLVETGGPSALQERILQGMRELVRECRAQLEQDGVPLVVAAHRIEGVARDADSPRTADRPAGQGRFDPLWENFPAIDIFEPWQFETEPDAAAAAAGGR